MDPRVLREGSASVEDVRRQVELLLQVRDALSDARVAAARVEGALENAKGRSREELELVREDLVTAPRRYSPPMLVDQLSYLYSNLDRADQLPGRDAFERYQTLRERLDGHLHTLERLLGATDSEAVER